MQNLRTTIIYSIKDLLLWHDCVIVPGLGGFVANYAPSSIDQNKNLFKPPFKKIAFNRNLTANDGLLNNHIAAVEEIPYKEASEHIALFVKDILASLDKGKETELDGIGKLKRANNNLFFEPSAEPSLVIDAFGLSQFHSAAVKRDPLHKKIEKQFKDRTLQGGKKVSYKKWLVAAAALPVAILLAFSPLQHKVLDELQTNYTIAIPFFPSSEPAYKARVSEESAIEQIKTADILEEDEAIATTIAPEAKAKALEKQSGYFIIGGCFSIKSNADKFMRDLRKKGHNPQLVDQHNGLYRVSYNGYTTREDAVSALLDVKSENSSAWILTSL